MQVGSQAEEEAAESLGMDFIRALAIDDDHKAATMIAVADQ